MSREIRPANAGAVTRALVAAGMPKGESHASGMVRGWHTYYRGVVSEQGGNHRSVREVAGRYRDGTKRYRTRSVLDPDGWVHVTWQFGDADREKDNDHRTAEATKQMEHAAEILRGKGFHVEAGVARWGYPALRVCRKNEAGEVVIV